MVLRKGTCSWLRVDGNRTLKTGPLAYIVSCDAQISRMCQQRAAEQ